jgi:hypothetical protein
MEATSARWKTRTLYKSKQFLKHWLKPFLASDNMPYTNTKHRHKESAVSFAAMTLWRECYELWDQLLLVIGSIYDQIVNKPNHHARRTTSKGTSRKGNRRRPLA